MTPSLETQLKLDPSATSEDLVFAPSHLIDCAVCARKNSPDRAACIYCGKDLGNPQATMLAVRRPENWEQGFTVIARQLPIGQPSLNAIASLLSIEIERLLEMGEANETLPLIRVENGSIAEDLASRIAAFGGECFVIPDAELKADKPPSRLKRIDLDVDEIAFTDFNTQEVYRTAPGDLLLIVIGRLITSRIDTLEKRRRGGQSDLIDETSTSSDELVADIYTRGDAAGFRIRLTGFDFSSLGDERKLIAAQNFRLLMQRLRNIATNASLVDYSPIRHFLDKVWEPDFSKDTMSRKSAGLAKRGFGRVATTSNALQFTKFSRMQWYLRNSL